MLATKSTLRCDTPRRWNLTRAALIAALFGAIPAAAAESECALGAYRLSDGSVIDVAAASEGALRWRGLDGASGAFGFQGPSQGGWIAPLAATRTQVDFLIVSFGLAVSVADEDREAIAFQMGLKGYGPDVIAKAQEIGAATTRIFASGMSDGIEELDAVRARYRDEPWYKDVYGNYTHLILGMTAEEIRTKGQV